MNIRGKVPSGSAHGSGRLGAGICTLGQMRQDQNSNGNQWPLRQSDAERQYVALRNNGRSPVLAVVGDVACQPGETEPAGEKAGENCATRGHRSESVASQAATAKQIENMKPDLVALVGDEQYQVGQYSDFENSYELTYGAFKFDHAARARQPRVLYRARRDRRCRLRLLLLLQRRPAQCRWNHDDDRGPVPANNAA